MTTIEINLSRNKCSWKLGNIFCTTQLNPPKARRIGDRRSGTLANPTEWSFPPEGKSLQTLAFSFFFVVAPWGWLFQNRWQWLPSSPQRSRLCFWDSAKLSSLTYDVRDSIWSCVGWVTWREVKDCLRNSVGSNLWLTGKFKGVQNTILIFF